jgi:hypothetical protein
MKYYRMAIGLFTIAGISARGPGTVTDYSSRAVLRGADHVGVPQRAPASRESTPQHACRLFQDQLTNHLTADFHAQLAPIRGGRSGFGQ